MYMKKILIILGIILFIVIGGVWAYLFIYGVPKDAGEVFARFQTSSDKPVFVGDEPVTIVDVAPETTEGTPQRLRQITTRPVAGATILDGIIRYVERGTGHVYDINLLNGEEEMVSGTTIAKTVSATFSPHGDYVAITKINAGESEVIAGTLLRADGGGSIDGITLPRGAREVAFTDASSTVSYYLPNVYGGTAFAYTILTKKSIELFSTPLQDAQVLWGKNNYVYTTPSAIQNGSVYRMSGNTLEYLTSAKRGLTAFAYEGGVTISESTENGIQSTDLNTSMPIPVVSIIPEKCAASRAMKGILYCGSPRSFDATKQYPDDWYKGITAFSDVLFIVNAPSSTVQVVSNLEEESGRPIDIIEMGINREGTLLYFINKNDNALWVFDTVRR